MRIHRELAPVVLTVAVLTSCATAQAPTFYYSGGDGSSQGQPVTILGAKTEQEFRAAEAAWLNQKLPGSRVESGNFVLDGGASHAVTVLLSDGSRKTVYFDMSGLGR